MSSIETQRCIMSALSESMWIPESDYLALADLYERIDFPAQE